MKVVLREVVKVFVIFRKCLGIRHYIYDFVAIE